MATRAVDLRLDRETRSELAFRVVYDCLCMFKDRSSPNVPLANIEQMIRLVEDEVRAAAARAICHFVVEDPPQGEVEQAGETPEQRFRLAAEEFLRRVWPKESSLVTPGLSKVLARLPAASRSAFTEAVHAIERFLVPFDCWSMLEYDLYGDEGDQSKLSRIDNPEKAGALLRLLDRTIGYGETAVIPYDLAEAVEQIRKVAPDLANSRSFLRLSTASRRA